MPELTRGSLALHYRVSGSGPALILIGGMGMPLQGWSGQAGDLSRAHRLIRLDNRGCGRSDTPEEAFSLADMAGDVLALMDHLSVASAHILGASMGGFIALELALAAPNRVSSLILAHTAPALPPLARQRLLLRQDFMEAGLPDRVLAMEQMIWVFPETALEKESQVPPLLALLEMGKTNQSNAGFKSQVRACANFDLRPRTGEIKAPALLISSRDDISIPLAHTRKLEALPGFRRTKIFDSGGHATHLIHPKAFNRTVLDFLSELS